MQQHAIRQRQESELDRFMNDTLDTHYIDNDLIQQSFNTQPLRWWRERGKGAYPLLTTMAFDLFATPSMSSECERAFSSAKRLITDERYSLQCDIIEADQCLKSWLKHGIANGREAFTSIADDTDDVAIDR